MVRTRGASIHSLGTFRQEEETQANSFVHRVLLDADLWASNVGRQFHNRDSNVDTKKMDSEFR